MPFVSKSWDGNTSDTKIFQERAQTLLATLQTSPSPRYLIADAKLYNEANAANLHSLGFSTRIPHTLKLVSQVITQALRWDTWHRVHDTGSATNGWRYVTMGWRNAGWWYLQRPLLQRAEATRQQSPTTRNYEAIEKPLCHLQAKRFETPEAAQAALGTLATSWTSHQVGVLQPAENTKRYACQGRPTPTTPIKAIEWHIQGHVRPDDEQIA